MKRIINYILFTVLLALLSGGCGGQQGREGAGASGEAVDPAAVLSLRGRDNSLDAYTAAVNIPLQVENPADAMDGGGERVFLGATGARYFKKHLFEDVDQCWDELSSVTAEGKTASEHFDRKNQLWDVGPVAGTDHYAVFDYEAREDGEGYRYFLTERDENHAVLREFPLDFLDGSDFSEVAAGLTGFAVDCSGAVHLLRQTGEGQQYLLVSSAGEVLAEYIPKDGVVDGLVPLYDGGVAFRTAGRDGEVTSLRYMDTETGGPVQLAELDKFQYCMTLFDEHTLLYADQEGVYRSGLSGKKPELLYRWIDHGITVYGVPAMQADGEGGIALLYEGAGNDYYLRLEPVAEEVELCELTLAVPSYGASFYQYLAAEFNRQYPACHIELKEYDYADAKLLTELTVGKGPVLVDTFLTGFEEQEELWEPLDSLMDRLGIAEELQPSALEMGRINGKLYGIVTDFRLRTLVTGNPDLKDWDYDVFLQCVDDSSGLEAVFNQYDGDFGTYFIAGFISHGIEDSYFLEAEKGSMRFDSGRFRRALEVAGKYCVREDGVDPGSSMLEGKVLCNELTVSSPGELALYRVCYGQDANYIGYPTKEGAAHFLQSGGGPLAIRRTAAKEEKEAAAAFLSLCLSYEGQSRAAEDMNFALSVRKDVLEEQFASMDESATVFVPGFGEITLGDDLDMETDRRTLQDMLEKARPERYFPGELRSILFEELELYFSGSLTEDTLTDHLESRLGLYLGEE